MDRVPLDGAGATRAAGQTYAKYLGSFLSRPPRSAGLDFALRRLPDRQRREEVFNYRRAFGARRDDEPFSLHPAVASLVGAANRRLRLRAARVRPVRLPPRLPMQRPADF